MKKVSYMRAVMLFGAVFMMSGGAYAQEADSGEFMLEEVTVTAQKREENQQKVAISMDVISGEELQGTGKKNVDDILKDLANVMINKSSDGMRVTVRGLADEDGPFRNLHVSTPTVAVNIDGAYNSQSNAGQNLFDLERVEVLAGPQSTLYGSNSPGGIVNVVTASPKTDRYSASGSVEYGSYDLLNAQVMLNAPVIKELVAVRVAAQKTERGSWIDGGDNAQDSKTARLKTLFQPNEDFSAGVTVSWAENGSGGNLGGTVKLFDYQDGSWVTVDSSGNVTKNGKVTNPWTTSSSESGGAASADAATKGLQAEISWDTAVGALSFVPSYSNQESTNFDAAYVNMDGTVTRQYSENTTEQKGAELRLASPADFFFKWILGGTYYKSDRVNLTDDYDSDANDSLANATQDNRAVYANLTYPVTERFRGTAGYRRSWDSVSNLESPAKVGNGVTGQDYSNPDYKIGMEYDLADSSMVYANYATSYRVNAMALSQGEGKSIPPEELKAYTLGAKNRFLDNRIQVNTSAYFYDYQNKFFEATQDGRLGGGAPGSAPVIISESDYPHDGLAGTDLNNDGDITDTTADGSLSGNISDPWIQQFGDFESFGVDVSAEWVITSKDRLNLSLSYMNTEWTDAVAEYYWSWIWPTVDYSGKENTFSPKWSGTASFQHNFELGGHGSLVPQADVRYQSEYVLSFADFGDVNIQEAHYILNGSLTYTSPGGMWSLNAYVKNAADYAVKTFWMNQAGSYTLGLNDPRTFGAVVSVKF